MRSHTTTPATRRAGGLRLLVLDDGLLQEHELPAKGTLVIGRSSAADLQLDHPEVSRRHLELTIDGKMQVKDLGSRNGIEVGGRKVSVGETAVVSTGEAISLGALTLIVQRASAPCTGTTITVDGKVHEIRCAGKRISLARRPVLRRLLYALASTEACEKEVLVRTVWNVAYHPLRHDNVLRVTIHELRALLRPLAVQVECVDGGYRMTVAKGTQLRVA